MAVISDEIRVGNELLDYAIDAGKIVEELISALDYADHALGIVETDVYRGKASVELQMFYSSLSAHLSRLIMLYSNAQTFIGNTYKTMHLTDEHLANWVMSHAGEWGENDGR